MKFLRLSTLALVGLGFLAQTALGNTDADEEFVPTEQKPFNIRVTYDIDEHPQSFESTNLIELVNGEEISVTYNIKNGEEESVSVVGVAGSFNDPVTGLSKRNLTASSVGPLKLLKDMTFEFTQKIGIDLEPENYLFVPSIYVLKDDQLMLLGSKNQLITVSDPQISVFQPQMLFLELVLLASFGGIIYALYATFGASYFQKPATAPKNKKVGSSNAKKTKKNK